MPGPVTIFNVTVENATVNRDENEDVASITYNYRLDGASSGADVSNASVTITYTGDTVQQTISGGFQLVLNAP